MNDQPQPAPIGPSIRLPAGPIRSRLARARAQMALASGRPVTIPEAIDRLCKCWEQTPEDKRP